VQSKIDSSENRIDYVATKEILSEKITKWINNFSNRPSNSSKPRFAIYHPDLSVNNIFINWASNITCIIDWAFCSTIPLFTLLIAPSLPQSQYELNVLLLFIFEAGFKNALGKSIAM